MAFGDEASSAQRTANPNYDSSETRKGYTGYEKDTESGLEFAQARYYNLQHGRFTSVDPLTASANMKNPQTFNRYSYVLNSPYKFVDPLGLISSSTGACGTWCQNSGGSVDGSAFRGRDSSLDWAEFQDSGRAGDLPENPDRNQRAHRRDSCKSGNCSAQNGEPDINLGRPVLYYSIEPVSLSTFDAETGNTTYRIGVIVRLRAKIFEVNTATGEVTNNVWDNYTYKVELGGIVGASPERNAISGVMNLGNLWIDLVDIVVPPGESLPFIEPLVNVDPKTINGRIIVNGNGLESVVEFEASAGRENSLDHASIKITNIIPGIPNISSSQSKPEKPKYL